MRFLKKTKLKIKMLILLFLISLLLSVTGCNGGMVSKEKDFEIQFLAATPVKTGEFSTYTVLLAATKAQEVEKVYLYMNMEGMNHPLEGTMESDGDGTREYRLDLPLPMAGEWYAVVRLYQGDNVVHTERFKVLGEGEMDMEYITGYNADNQ